MKKVLLATSALVLTAGAAAADISLSGSARMGVVYDSTLDGGDGATYFSSRVRIVFTASGETDTGLSFGASVRADQQGGNNNDGGEVGGVKVDKDGDSNGDSTVFISGAFGKLTMGDVDGAADSLVGQVSGVGYGPNDALQEIGFVGTDKTAVYYEYSAGALTFGLGVGQTRFVDGDSATRDTVNVGVKYAADGYSVALAYEQADDIVGTPDDEEEALLSLGASATFGAATIKARVSDSDIADKDTTWALSVDYGFGDTTVTAFYTDFGNTTSAGDDVKHIGLGASYALGGGATLAGGVVRQNTETADETFADIGIKFSF